MSRPWRNNGSDLASTSKAEPHPSLKSEKEFLSYQASVAKKALSTSVRATAGQVLTALDPRAWAQRFPLPTTGLAAAVGFVAVVHRHKKPETIDQNLPTETPPQTPATSLFSMVVEAGIDILKKALVP